MTFKGLLNYYSEKCEKLNKELSSVKILLLDYFKINNTTLYLQYEQEISENDLLVFNKLSDKYLYENIPVQYLIGYTYFYNLKFKVNPHVLIPRFETEILVDEILKRVSNKETLDILDIGTGSGCIAISLKKNLPLSKIEGIDISKEAIDIATENSDLNNLEVIFYQSDLFNNVSKNKKYDIIVSNPPYIPFDGEVDQLVFNNEPHLALFAGENGLYFYREIIKQSQQFLKQNGMLAFEIGYNQKDDLICLIEKYLPNSSYEFIKDFNHYDRVVFIYPNVR